MNVAHFSRKEPNLEQDSRLEQLQAWLKIVAREKVGDPPFSAPEPASADASFRRYFRVRRGDDTFIAMDAPPQHEDCEPFVRISGWLAQMGLHVPEVLAWDRENGFLLLTDLGTTDYQTALNNSTADALYADALDALVTLQTHGDVYLSQLPPYDARLLHEEMVLFSDWLVDRYVGLPLPAFWMETAHALVESAQAQPAVFVHRDYHSRNLMVTTPNPGILDFQDAVAGPLTYDAVSLLRDCYVRWPEEKVAQWRDAYFDRLVEAGLQQRGDHGAFVRAFDLMGVQRHLKAAGIFARLWLRDGKARYLDDVPNTLRYIAEVGERYRETAALAQWVGRELLPTFMEAHGA